MKFARALGLALAAALIPSVAVADDVPSNDPYEPQPTQQPAPAPTQAPSTTSTTIVTPPPAPAPQAQSPVVVVPDQSPRTTIIERDPEGVEHYDRWNAPVFATGAVVFAGSYGASAIVAATSDHVGAARV